MKSGKSLPNIGEGWVCKQYVKRGQKLCGPYWYRFWREDGRLKKAYVRPVDLEEVRKGCQAWQTEQKRMRHERALTRQSRSFFSDLNKSLKACHGF